MHIALFHSALGLRPSLLRWATDLRGAGHTVHTPDLYDGAIFDDLEAGVARRDQLGIPELSRRAAAAVDALPADLVYAGLSMGAASAQFLALTRPGARGVLLLHGALPLAMLGVDTWPAALPCEIHVTEEDPWVDHDAVATLGGSEQVAIHRYPGAAHLFTDEDSADYQPGSAHQVRERATAFLTRLG